MANRVVSVTLMAQVSQYVQEMERARRAAEESGDRELGVDPVTGEKVPEGEVSDRP